MKKQLQTRINQEEKEKNYNSLSSRVYRVCTAPSTFEELEKSIKSKVITPFGEVQVDVLFLGREIVMKFFHGKKKYQKRLHFLVIIMEYFLVQVQVHVVISYGVSGNIMQEEEFN